MRPRGPDCHRHVQCFIAATERLTLSSLIRDFQLGFVFFFNQMILFLGNVAAVSLVNLN